MYVYDTYDKTLINQRVAEFRGQVARRVNGELTEDQFKPLRLLNGLYLQLHAYMLRVCIPYGVLSSHQMRKLAHVARRYDKGYGHFTTRQNIQFNWSKLEETPDILYELAEVDLHAIQTSGNVIRNTTSDHFAGVSNDEVEDPRPYCEIIRQWSTLHPEFSFLPRKFKIAVTGSEHDRAAVKFHDIGLRLKKGANGNIGFEVLVGGGQGRTPVVAITIRNFLPKQQLLSYLEAILRVYNRHGRRDNIYKARIKILVRDLGGCEFAKQVEDEWRHARKTNANVSFEEEERIRAFFVPPPYHAIETPVVSFQKACSEDVSFRNWVLTNTYDHKIPGYAIVTISLKPHGGIPGDMADDQMDIVADLAQAYSFGEIRVTHKQNLVLAHIRQEDLFVLWQKLVEHGMGTANVGLATDIIACPGLDYCGLATARSIPIAQRISERFNDRDRLNDIGKISINISGCINACGHHHAGNIGILGVDKRGNEAYQITLGGRSDEHAAIGQIVGPGFSEERVVDAVENVVEAYIENREGKETFIETFDRTGLDPFKEKLYGTL